MSPGANDGGGQPRFFISHSARDTPVADALRRLLQDVFPYSSSFASKSSEGIPAERYSRSADADTVRAEMRKASHAFILLTPASVNLPWLAWEAGMAASIRFARIFPILFDLEPDEVPAPLLQFQLAWGDRQDDIRRVIDAVKGDVPSDQFVLGRLDHAVLAYLDVVHGELEGRGDAATRRDDTPPNATTATIDEGDARMLCELLFRLVVKRRDRPEMLQSVDAAAFWAAVQDVRPSAAGVEDLRALNAELASESAPGPLWAAWMRQVHGTELAALVLHPRARRSPNDRVS